MDEQQECHHPSGDPSGQYPGGREFRTKEIPFQSLSEASLVVPASPRPLQRPLQALAHQALEVGSRLGAGAQEPRGTQRSPIQLLPAPSAAVWLLCQPGQLSSVKRPERQGSIAARVGVGVGAGACAFGWHRGPPPARDLRRPQQTTACAFPRRPVRRA